MKPQENLNWRYATKVFDKTKKIAQEDLFQLKEALRLAPSSFGLQVWKFILIEDQSLKEQLRPHSWNQSQITDCSHLVVLCRPTTVNAECVDRYLESSCHIRKQTREEVLGYEKMMKGFLQGMTEEKKVAWANNQIYIALGQLMCTAAFMKIDTCPIEGFMKEKYDEVLKLKDKGLSSVVLCALGYRHKEDKYASAAKVRFPESEVFLKY